jgi:spermidine synthase
MRPTTRRAPAPGTPRNLPLLAVLFVLSGAAALIYEIAWFQLLSLVIGSSAMSLGIVLATFMGGLCVGSLYLSRLVSARARPLRVYAFLEIGICALGVLVTVALPWAGGLYGAIGGSGAGGLLVRVIVCAVCLVPPTALMGATLPAIARRLEASPEGVSRIGLLYGGNTAGAVLGCLAAGFWLLRVHDVTVATLVAAGLNVSVALVAFVLDRAEGSARESALADGDASRPGRLAPGSRPVLVAIALSGATALGAEVVWTRLLTLNLGGTTYTFSLILGAFLLGIGLGSGAGAIAARSVADPRAALGWCQLLATAAIAWAAYNLTQALPYWPIHPGLATSPVSTFEIDVVRCLWTVLPGAALWGASFPLALAAVTRRDSDPARAAGAVLAANTSGAIAGALAASLVLVAWIGTQHAQRALIATAAMAALILLARHALARSVAGAATAAILVALPIAAASTVAPVPGLLVGYGRFAALRAQEPAEFLYVGEGRSTSLAVSELPNGVRNYHGAGKVQASSEPQDMRLQRMLGHLTTLVPRSASSVLVIGCGAGVTAGAVSIDPAVRELTIVEIEPLVPRVASRFFGEHNFGVLDRPKTTVRIDDARHFLVTSDEKYDAITSDPFDPWIKGAASLYTREFFELVRRHLEPGGVVTVWVQLYETSEAAAKSEIATFFDVFPNGLAFGNTRGGRGYDLVLVGQAEPAAIDLEAMDARLGRPEYAEVAESLREIGVRSAADLFATFAGDAAMLAPWLAGAEINRDRNLRLQYLAGLGLNQYRQKAIYDGMLAHRRYPAGVFAGTPETLESLRAAMQRRRR